MMSSISNAGDDGTTRTRGRKMSYRHRYFSGSPDRYPRRRRDACFNVKEYIYAWERNAELLRPVASWRPEFGVRKAETKRVEGNAPEPQKYVRCMR